MGFSRQEYSSGLPFFSSRGYSPSRDQTCTPCVSYVAGRFFTYWAIREAPKEVLLVPFSCSVVCDSLWPHGLQNARPPCPSPTPGACSNSCPSSRWCHPTISSSVAHFSFCPRFSSCPQSFPESGSFPMSRLFTSGGHSIGASASTPVLPMNIQDRFPLGLFWSPCCPRDSQGSSPAPQFEIINSSLLSLLYGPTLTSVHDYWKNHNFDYTDLGLTLILVCIEYWEIA